MMLVAVGYSDVLTAVDVSRIPVCPFPASLRI